MSIQGTQGITEQDIANYLVNTPGFFDRHAEVLATVQLTSPHGQRAVSLQERQMEMLRERIKGLEHRIVEMIRNAQDNLSVTDRLHEWTLRLLLASDAGDLPRLLVDDLKQRFLVPQAAIRVWGVADSHAAQPFAAGVSDDLKSFASSLGAPYCGINAGFEASRWFDEGSGVTSMAMIPLRVTDGSKAFGLLLLGSPDPTRYSADMGTELLARIGATASAALSRLLPPR